MASSGFNLIVEEKESAFKKRIQSYEIMNTSYEDPKRFLMDALEEMLPKINKFLKKTFAVKINATLVCKFTKPIEGKGDTVETFCLALKSLSLFRNDDITKCLKENIEERLLKKLEEFQERGSGWALSWIVRLDLNINKYEMIRGNSYIDLPRYIKVKQACVNINNTDESCFAWAVLSALFPVNANANRVTSYEQHYSKLKLKDITFPMTIEQIPRFEKQNDVSVNVYGLKLQRDRKEKYLTVPVYISRNVHPNKKHVNLLLIQHPYEYEDEENSDNMEDDTIIRYHYVWIKNMSRLLSTQISNRDGKKYFCDRCLHFFYSKERLSTHASDCNLFNPCKLKLPPKDKCTIQFRNFGNKIKSPFVIYADIECILEKYTSGDNYQVHKPCSVGFYVKCSYDPTLSFYKSYRGTNCMNLFSRELFEFAKNVETVFLCDLPMDDLSNEEERTFSNAINCHICEKPFSEDDLKVKDHCHLTGKYRGPAHNNCNLNFNDTAIIPVIFHNLSGYDSHFIIEELALEFEGKVDLLPVNKERYISFTKHYKDSFIKYRFIDSLRFLNCALDKLSSYLSDYPVLQSEMSHLSSNDLKLLTRKGVYPYDYFDCADKFLETELPPKQEFFNKLNETEIEEPDYNHAQNVWRTFKIKNLGEYSDLYLKTDVLLLADVFEQFRSSCLSTYQLDPAHYYSLPGFTWDAMLKCTNISLELLMDIDMIMFIERGIRGGLSQCSKRYSQANNKYMSEYDSSKQSKYLVYLDVNNQYGWAMSQSLPYGEFQWCKDIDGFNVDKITDDSATGYILEVDLEYPKEIHDLHKDLPFCPEHLCAPGSKQKKLIASLYNKTKYIIHYRSLKQALANGLVLKKVHRILQFRQSNWLKPYIDFNTKLRQSAKNDFEKNLFKLVINAVFGKTIENIRKHRKVKLSTKWEGRYGAGALIASPYFKSSTIFHENLIAIELSKSEICFNKPIYVGMCILDIAKTTLYDFHYNYMLSRFPSSDCSLCYTDTDSLIYEIANHDIYPVIKKDCHRHFDTSDYPENNQWNIPLVNKKVLGLMKDESNGKIMTEFIGLRSKMYATKLDLDLAQDHEKKLKGIKKNIVKDKITFDDYINCLKNKTKKTVSQNLIETKRHIVFSAAKEKLALSPHDDKRHLVLNSVETLPWGHYSLSPNNDQLTIMNENNSSL